MDLPREEFLAGAIAGELGAAEKTVEIDRSQVMRKMEAAFAARPRPNAQKLVPTLP